MSLFGCQQLQVLNTSALARTTVSSMLGLALGSSSCASVSAFGVSKRSSVTVPEESPAATTGNPGHMLMLVNGWGEGFPYVI